MDSASMRPPALLDRARRAPWGAIAVWSIGFGLVAYLGLNGGGYDPLVHDQVGIAVFWVLLAAVAVGALPRARLDRHAWLALGLFGAYVAWTALSLGWTESADRTFAELARVLAYAGVLALALFCRDRRDAALLCGAIAAAIALAAATGLLSRLHPAWFPAAADTGRILEDTERLSYPLNYWNGLAALIAIGLPLLLHAATSGRSRLLRSAAAAALPALALTLFFTLSRGGIAAAILALAVFLALAPNRLPKVATLVLAGLGSVVLIAAADSREALQQGLLNDAARGQGTEILWLTLGVCLVVGLGQAALFSDPVRARRPAWTRLPARHALVAAAVCAVVLLVGALLVGAPGRVSSGWDEFKQGGGPGSGTARLGSVAGQSRYQLWSAAVRENESKPLIGTGSGTFEFWWARDGDTSETVRDTHSLYLQTLGELGIVGLALLAAFLVVVLVAGGRLLLTVGAARRAAVAAALAGFTAFCITATFDWMWQLPVVPVAALLLASVCLAPRGSQDGPAAFPPAVRVGVAAISVVAIVAIAIPLASATLLRQSEADARDGDLTGALQAARSAENVQPDAAAPRLQQALVLEALGDLDAAAAAARGATDRESTNWRNWLVLSRIAAERGDAAVAVRAYRRARSLNPRAQLFRR